MAELTSGTSSADTNGRVLKDEDGVHRQRPWREAVGGNQKDVWCRLGSLYFFVSSGQHEVASNKREI